MEKEKYKKGGLLLSDNTVMLFDRMTEDEGVKFLRLILDYHKNGSIPSDDTERLISISFDLFKADYDASQKKYLAKVDNMNANRNRGRQKISEETTRNQQEISEISQEIASNTLHNTTLQNNYKESKPKKGVSLPLPNRKEEFKNELAQYRDSYEADMLNDFFQYWTQPNKSKTKMKFEDKKHWCTKARLDAWKRHKF